jgi:hypothetical protein
MFCTACQPHSREAEGDRSSAPVMAKGTVPEQRSWDAVLICAAARSLLRLYNAKGVFNNLDDDLAGLSDGLKARFGQVEIETFGCVALFRAC